MITASACGLVVVTWHANPNVAFDPDERHDYRPVGGELLFSNTTLSLHAMAPPRGSVGVITDYYGEVYKPEHRSQQRERREVQF